MRLEYFQLIDRIVDLSPADRTITAVAVVPTESTVFEGHFPGHPLMPGVLLVEAMAQASGWLVMATTNFERMPFLAKVKEAKLRKYIQPGTSLTIAAKVLHEGSGFAVTQAKIMTDGKTACEAELTFSVVPFPNHDLSGRMKEVAARINFPMGLLQND
jgi:3-hydroxyacyl-[acyl-carrier-protein] dehydratase